MHKKRFYKTTLSILFAAYNMGITHSACAADRQEQQKKQNGINPTALMMQTDVPSSGMTSEAKTAISKDTQNTLENIQQKLEKFKDKNYRNSNSKHYTRLKEQEKRLKKKRGEKNASNFVRFCAKYAPPPEIVEEINRFEEKVHMSSSDALPSVCRKDHDIHRIINAERLRTCIQEHKLDRLDVPKKYIYKIGSAWSVFAHKVKSSTRDFLLEDFKQLATVAEETGYRDWGLGSPSNIMVDAETQKLVFIDTEDCSFYVGRYSVKNLPKNCRVQSFTNMRMFNDFRMMNKEMADFYNERRAELEKSPEGVAEHLPLPRSTRFDKPDIDFEKVKKEYAALTARG